MTHDPRDVALAVLSVFMLLVLVAALVHRLAPERKPRLRTPTLLFCAQVLLAGGWLGARAVGATDALRWFDLLGRVVGGVTVVALTSLGLLDILLRRVGRPVPAIVADLLTAAGYALVLGLGLAGSGIDPTSAVAGTTVIAAVLTISLQGTLGNVVGGVALQLDGSLQVGDWVRLEGGREGRVTAIRWRHVVLDTREGDAIVVPNAILLAQPFTLLGKREGEAHPHRQAVTFRVDFRHPPARVCEVVLAAVRASPLAHVAETPAPAVVCLELGRAQDESSALYAVRYWITDLARDTTTDSDVRARIHAGLRRAGIPLALPTVSNLNAEADDAEGQRARRADRAYAVLRGLDLFAALSDAECARLAEGVAHVPFAPGEVITRQGAVAHFLYVVASGTVEVRVALEGQPARTWDLHAPAFFGEMGLLTGEPRRASVVARTPVDCLKLERAVFEEVLVQRPEVANGLAEAIARRQAELDAATAREGANAPGRASSATIATAIRRFFGL